MPSWPSACSRPDLNKYISLDLLTQTPPLWVSTIPFQMIMDTSSLPHTWPRLIPKTTPLHEVCWGFSVQLGLLPLTKGPPTQSTPAPPDETSPTPPLQPSPVTRLASPPSVGRRQVGTSLANLDAQYLSGKEPPNSAGADLRGTETEAAAHSRMPPKQFLLALKGARGHSSPTQCAEVCSDWLQKCKAQTCQYHQAKYKRISQEPPMNRHDLQISMPGPSGTADTAIGRPGLRYLGEAFCKTSLSPAHNSYKTSISTLETPPTPRSAPSAGQCKVPRKATALNRDANRVKPSPNILSCDNSRRKINPPTSPERRKSRQHGTIMHSSRPDENVRGSTVTINMVNHRPGDSNQKRCKLTTTRYQRPRTPVRLRRAAKSTLRRPKSAASSAALFPILSSFCSLPA